MKSDMEQVVWNVAAGAGGGAIRHVAKFVLNPKTKWPSLLAGSIIGCICAVFITPWASKMFGLSTDPDKVTGLAFLFGVLGLESVELMIRKLRKMFGIEDDKQP